MNSLWPQFVPKDGDIGPEGVGSGCCGDRVWHVADATTMCTSCWDGKDKEVEMVGEQQEEAARSWAGLAGEEKPAGNQSYIGPPSESRGYFKITPLKSDLLG